MKKIVYISAWIFSLLFTVGLLFKILHFPYATILLYAGQTGAGILCFPLILFIKRKEGKLDNNKVFNQWISGQVALIIFIASTYLRFIDHLYANIFMSTAFLIFAFLFLPLLFYNMYQQSLTQI